MKRILVTGGLGYLGGRISAHLAAVLPPGSVRISTRSPGLRPKWTKAIEVVPADVRDLASLRAAMRDVEAVVHLASVDENVSRDDPDLALEVNGRGTCLALEAATREDVRRFLYISTFHVYGPSAESPITERSPTRPVHPYAITHHLAEDFVWQYRQERDMDAVVVRLSNGFGYPMDEGVNRWTLVFNDLCRQAVASGRLVLSTSGLQERDFVPLGDVAAAVAHLLALPTGSLGDGLFNLGSGRTLSIRAVAELVAQRFLVTRGRSAVIQSPDPQPGALSPPAVRFDVSRLLATGFQSRADWNAEVDATLDVAEKVVAGAR